MKRRSWISWDIRRVSEMIWAYYEEREIGNGKNSFGNECWKKKRKWKPEKEVVVCNGELYEDADVSIDDVGYHNIKRKFWRSSWWLTPNSCDRGEGE